MSTKAGGKLHQLQDDVEGDEDEEVDKHHGSEDGYLKNVFCIPITHKFTVYVSINGFTIATWGLNIPSLPGLCFKISYSFYQPQSP